MTAADQSDLTTSIHYLVSALYRRGRLNSRRVHYLEPLKYHWADSRNRLRNSDGAEESYIWGTDFAELELIFQISIGGTIAIIMPPYHYGVSQPVGWNHSREQAQESLRAIAQLVQRYRNQVQIVVCFGAEIETENVEAALERFFPTTPFVHLAASEADADYIESLAAEYLNANQFANSQSVLDEIQQHPSAPRSEIISMLDQHIANHHLETYWPEYVGIATFARINEQSQHEAEQRIVSLVGLEQTKNQYQLLLNHFRVQKHRLEREITSERPTLNMIFAGNPGTGKTTFARLMGEVFAREGILSKGKLYEFTGNQFVNVIQTFERTRGSIIFIDEAYDLSPSVISDLVAAMENYRHQTAVVLAGYGEEMDLFLQRNPGLASRIPHRIEFQDYNCSELMQIAERVAGTSHFTLAPEAHCYLSDYLTLRRYLPGNGRDVRTIIESAIVRASARFAQLGIEQVSDDDLRTLQPSDFELFPDECEPTSAEEFAGLIGMVEAKATITCIIAHLALQRTRIADGLPAISTSMHMLFTGNPGTGKTTFARIVGKMMRERGVLPIGKFYEVGRSDLVGRYAGHTAPLVRKAFKRAKGSILFIDEAYSLANGDQFGQEAIATIVQEMENNREDTLVIFAGYADAMKDFVNSNDGLKSRIAHTIHFADYTGSELYEIALGRLKEWQMHLASDADQELMTILERFAVRKNTGNGRLVRNLLEQATLHQATRLTQQNLDTLTHSQKQTLTHEDITHAEKRVTSERTKYLIGFAA